LEKSSLLAPVFSVFENRVLAGEKIRMRELIRARMSLARFFSKVAVTEMSEKGELM
jgi:hypothetical protein